MSPDHQSLEATPPPNGKSVFKNEDLVVLLKELRRVRDTADIDGQSAGEALTLAGTAVRIVEAEFGRVGRDGLSPGDVTRAREVLQGALEALQAAAYRVAHETEAVQPARRRTLWQRRKESRTS